MGGLLHLVQQRGGDWARSRSLPRPLLAVPNVTAHSSTASVQVTVLLYNGPFLYGFNVPIKGLNINEISVYEGAPCTAVDSRLQHLFLVMR